MQSVTAIVMPTVKNFADWWDGAFGYSYGTGEIYIIPALRIFMENVSRGECGQERQYDSEKIEEQLGPAVAWLLINALCSDGVIDYGTSPRFGWLNDKGVALRDFILAHTTDELYAMTDRDERDIVCYKDACNCGPKGFVLGKKCQNPFWYDPAP